MFLRLFDYVCVIVMLHCVLCCHGMLHYVFVCCPLCSCFRNVLFVCVVFVLFCLPGLFHHVLLSCVVLPGMFHYMCMSRNVSFLFLQDVLYYVHGCVMFCVLCVCPEWFIMIWNVFGVFHYLPECSLICSCPVCDSCSVFLKCVCMVPECFIMLCFGLSGMFIFVFCLECCVVCNSPV